jgi:hypothetical protein
MPPRSQARAMIDLSPPDVTGQRLEFTAVLLSLYAGRISRRLDVDLRRCPIPLKSRDPRLAALLADLGLCLTRIPRWT